MDIGDTFEDNYGYQWEVISVKPDDDPDKIKMLKGQAAKIGTAYKWDKSWGVRKILTLAKQPGPAPAQAQQGISYGGIMSWLPTVPTPVYQTIIKLEDDPKPAKTRLQVSHNGKDWVDYRHLLDADDFELYAHRREI